MAVKVYICWSGDLSNKLAEKVRQWLPSVLQFVRPYFTPTDIEKGTRWESDISGELNSSEIGIICLTKENLNKPWILFESGALSKNFDKSLVCTLLFDVETTDLIPPLTIFQNTQFRKEDFKKLVKTINAAGGESKLDDPVLDGVFEKWWPELEEQVKKILQDHETADEGDYRKDRDLLEEILELTRLRTRRSQPPIVASPKAMEELMGILRGLSVTISDKNNDHAQYLIMELDKPIMIICESLNLRDLFQQYRMEMSHIRRNLDKESESHDNI